MKKYFSKWLQTFSGCLKAVRVVLKRLPHSLRSFAMTDFLLSGSLKNRFSKLFKLCLITVFTFSAPPIFAQNDLDKTYHYTPGGKYRMFGAGRGKVEKVRNTINKITDTFKMGPLSIDTDQYSGYVYYEQRFSNHPLSEHGSFFNSDTIKIGDIHGNIFRGNLGYTNAKINGYETHPVDGYDAADGGDHPYDIYTYHVTGTVKTTSIQPLELPKLPKFSNPFSNKNADIGQNKNGLPENNPADANDRTRDLVGSGNLPNTLPESGDITENNGEVPLPKSENYPPCVDCCPTCISPYSKEDIQPVGWNPFAQNTVNSAVGNAIAGGNAVELAEVAGISYAAAQSIIAAQQHGANKKTVSDMVSQAQAVSGGAMPPDDNGGNDKKNKASNKKSSAGDMQKQVEKGKAPNSVDRVDKGRGSFEKDHVHFKGKNGGSALNSDGTWKHGSKELTNAEKKWLQKNGWSLPK